MRLLKIVVDVELVRAWPRPRDPSLRLHQLVSSHGSCPPSLNLFYHRVSDWERKHGGNTLRRSRLVSISPVTSATLRELGFEPHAEADIYTMSGVVDAMVDQSMRHPMSNGPNLDESQP